jgi:response regulator RpfG family c-di-GMP phosphodiesterase
MVRSSSTWSKDPFMSFKNSLLFRRSDELPGASAASKPCSADGGKLGKIVVAESDPSDLDHIASLLRNLNFTVLTAPDGKTALTLTRRHKPLLVLSALELPQIDGYRLAQELRERKDTEHIPFMFVLAGGQTPARLVGHETYAHDYIQRPLSISELESRVMSLVGPAIRRREEVGAGPLVKTPAEETRAREATRADGVREEACAVDATLAKMRRLLAELSDSLGFLERKSRLRRALGDSRPEVDRTDHRRTAPKVVEGGHLIRFQNARDDNEESEGSSPEMSARPERDASGPELATPYETAERDRILEKLEKYRAEYRGLAGTDEEEPAAALAAPPPHIGRAGVGEVPETDTDVPSESEPIDSVPLEDLEDAFDSDLLVKLGVRVDEPAAVKIKEEEFTRFARQSFLSAFLDESEKPGKRESLYEEAQDYVLRSIRRAAVGGSPYVSRAEMLIGRLIDSLAKGDELLLRATQRDPVFSVSGHSVNVAVLSIRISQIQGRNPQFQSRVGLAALFHEIGVVRLPEKLVFKEEPLTEEELNVLRKRPLFSARVLQENFRLVGDIAGQVFEREDGSGHPMGLRSGEIRDEARIIGVADFFEACIHRRPYREPLTGYQALYELSRDGEFQQDAVRALVSCVSLFPFNEILLLNTGEVARVVGINPGHPARPRLRLLLDRDGAEVREPREIDLLEDRGVDVAEVLTLDALARRRPR